MSRNLYLTCFILLCITYAICFIHTSEDYGMVWDEAHGELHLGDRYLGFLQTFDSDYLDFSKPKLLDVYSNPDHPNYPAHSHYAVVNKHHIWGTGPILSALSKQVFYTKLKLFEPIAAHHLANLFLVLFQFILIYYACNKLFSAKVGLLACTFLAVSPRYLAGAHFNIKDIPEAVFFTTCLLLCFLAYQYRSKLYLYLSCIFFAIAIATKPNAAFIPIICLPLFLAYIYKHKKSIFLVKKIIVSSLVLVLTSIFFYFVLNPYLLVNYPEELFKHIDYILGWSIRGTDHWDLKPILKFLSTTPFVILLGLIVALVFILGRKLSYPIYLSFLLWLIIPVARVSIPSAYDVDGIRHWIEFLPAACILSALGYTKLESLIKPYILNTAIVILILPTLYWIVKVHPNQLVYFNFLFGGIEGAKLMRIEPTDYWANSYRQGLAWLSENAEENSNLIVGVSPAIIAPVVKTELRSDIKFFFKFKDLKELVEQDLNFNQKIYLMYIIRKKTYSKFLKMYFKNLPPTYSISVDGHDILRIIEMDKELFLNQIQLGDKLKKAKKELKRKS